MNKEQISSHFAELIKDGKQVLQTLKQDDFEESVDEKKNAEWRMSVLALVMSAFGQRHPYFTQATSLVEKGSWKGGPAKDMFGLLNSAAKAWDRGYVFDIQKLAEAAIEADLLEQSEELAGKGYYLAAAVLAGAVLEQHLRSICESHGVPLHKPDGKPKTIEPINMDLRNAGVYDALQQKQITYLAGLRNSAAHNDGFTAGAEEVKAMIRDVQSICSRLR